MAKVEEKIIETYGKDAYEHYLNLALGGQEVLCTDHFIQAATAPALTRATACYELVKGGKG